MRGILAGIGLLTLSSVTAAQPPGKWPPDSLVNVKVFARTTPVNQVVAQMRNITSYLGVRCHFCHVGEERMPLERYDFASDEKRMKLVARQMMLMVQEINRRVDTLPGGSTSLEVTCETCHRGVTRPMPLPALLVDVVQESGADSAVRAYRALRSRYYGRDAYDFGEESLTIAAGRLGRSQKYAEALALVSLNEEFFPRSAGSAVSRGNILLLRGDTTGAADAYREAIRRDSTSNEARQRLRAIGRQP